MIIAHGHPVLTDEEARAFSLLSQRVGSLAELRRILGVSTSTLDRICWRNRRVRAATMARFRAGLEQAYAARILLAELVADELLARAISSVGTVQ